MPVIQEETGDEIIEEVSEDELLVHTHNHGSGNPSAVTLDENGGDDGPFTCPYCDLTYDYVIELDDDYLYYVNVTDDVYECWHCDYSHEEEPQVKRHYSMEHRE